MPAKGGGISAECKAEEEAAILLCLVRLFGEKGLRPRLPKLPGKGRSDIAEGYLDSKTKEPTAFATVLFEQLAVAVNTVRDKHGVSARIGAAALLANRVFLLLF